jgi:hypothetical protein
MWFLLGADDNVSGYAKGAHALSEGPGHTRVVGHHFQRPRPPLGEPLVPLIPDGPAVSQPFPPLRPSERLTLIGINGHSRWRGNRPAARRCLHKLRQLVGSIPNQSIAIRRSNVKPPSARGGRAPPGSAGQPPRPPSRPLSLAVARRLQVGRVGAARRRAGCDRRGRGRRAPGPPAPHQMVRWSGHVPGRRAPTASPVRSAARPSSSNASTDTLMHRSSHVGSACHRRERVAARYSVHLMRPIIVAPASIAKLQLRGYARRSGSDTVRGIWVKRHRAVDTVSNLLDRVVGYENLEPDDSSNHPKDGHDGYIGHYR